MESTNCPSIRPIDFSDLANKACPDMMAALVQRMLDLHKQRQSAAGEAARARIAREIHVSDEQTDALVYVLYRLTEEEIKLVERISK